jgi:pyruvate/2-oxoglutarate dehydrogenase complex dihydrolipoamide acyltransferase (E2) component
VAVSPSSPTTSAPDANASAAAAATPPKPAAVEGSWVNEETAEQDKALALLSEGCQIYLRGVLQNAVQCARQRQNLDGIRLWHQQHTFGKGASGSAGSKDTKNKSTDKSKKPPLALRLGCDVSRQAAQAQGNAALTVKRMEEALDRQTGIPMRVRQLDSETMLEATSMGDLSWRPLLKKGAEKADYQAKRSFEVYGGREAKDPPLGRVPKKAKLLVEDFVMGSGLVADGPYHKAFTASSSISF